MKWYGCGHCCLTTTGASRHVLSGLFGDVYRRFHTPYPRVPEWTPEFLMDADERGGRSMSAVVGEETVGHAMCSRPVTGEVEVATVVEDRWQGRGVGRLLLFELADDAKGRGV